MPPSYYLANWWPRVGATLLDGLIVAPVNIALALGFHLYTVILICRDGEHNGQTLGKQWVGLRVVRNDGKPIDLKTAIVREGLVKTLPGVIGSLSALLGVVTS